MLLPQQIWGEHFFGIRAIDDRVSSRAPVRGKTALITPHSLCASTAAFSSFCLSFSNNCLLYGFMQSMIVAGGGKEEQKYKQPEVSRLGYWGQSKGIKPRPETKKKKCSPFWMTRHIKFLWCCYAKGRIPLPNRVIFWKNAKGGGSFSIQKFMLQILGTLNRAFWAWNW